MKIADIRTKDDSNLYSILLDLGKEGFNLRFQSKYQPLENPSRIRQVRRTIAKVKTVLNERKIKAGV